VVRRPIFGAVLALAFAVPAYAHAAPAEDTMRAEINDARKAGGLPALRESPLLSKSAASYSRYMLARDYFGHLETVRASSKFAIRGEVLAWYEGSNPRVGATVRTWLSSPAHRMVILHPRMRYVGAGLERGQLGGRFATVWTIHVGSL
jgi:uncharacterized protein YkwD